MIGLIANATDLQIAEEFFELFKTHWEWAIPGRKYRVVLSTNGDIENLDAEVFLVYGSGAVASDRQTAMPVEQVSGPAEIGWGCATLPIYGQLALFEAGTDSGVLTSAGKTVDYRHRSGSRVVWRIGYDLFGEVRHLLTEGQPVSHATTPTLELHIALLRHVLLESGIPFVEIPPRPHGYDFICCLTHDVDFFGIRRHKFDRTLAGFVGRALVGSLTDLVRGRRPPVDAARNWLAVLSLPFVFLGLVPDFWRPFDDYAEVENGRRSTFFLVPFKGRPGASPNGSVDATRAVPYQVSEIRADLSTAAGRGAELAVHGINAWRDAAAGVAEMRELTSLTGQQTAGVRMHWLYFGADSPRQLETAGFAYDSTCGYNDAVGYRAGTSQAFRLPGTENLMELPLSIMDSALFYPRQMGLAHEDALKRCFAIVTNARRFGGTVVINWHDRSLAPERLWGRCYQELLDESGRDDRAWFATASEAVEWFRWRRSIRFTGDPASSVVTIAAPALRTTTPAALIQTHRPAGSPVGLFEEHRLDGREAMAVEL
jgi:hypothetical protein